MDICRFPDDILGYIASNFLSQDDVARLVDAISCGSHRPRARADVERVPAPLRWPWMLHHTCGELSDVLRRMAEVALYWSRDPVNVVHAYVNWSPFAGYAPAPLATYAWNLPALRITTCVEIDHPCVELVVRRAIAQCLPCVRISLHAVTRRRAPEPDILCPRPLLVSTVQMFAQGICFP